MSETAITVAPLSCSSDAATPPTLPKPCTTQRCWSSSRPSRWHARSAVITTPAPVASRRKIEPPTEIGLPVTTSGTAWPTQHRVRVHHPRHRLLVRRHVGRRDVGLRADLAHELGREAARQPLELARRERIGDRSGCRPSRRRTAAGAARTSTSSTTRARRTRRATLPRRSECRPSSGRAPSSAARGSRRRSGSCRRRDEAAPRRSPRAPGSSSRSATICDTSAYGSACSNWARAIKKSGVSHSRGCSSGDAWRGAKADEV